MMAVARRRFCHLCGRPLTVRPENGVDRPYCAACHRYFYDNPLPVVSAVVEEDRRILLVQRANEPSRGQWCLPTGFAESGEEITAAALRELAEETGVEGRIVRLLDVDSALNPSYGDLLFLTFEVERVGGRLRAGDDAAAARFFPLADLPPLAFPSNTKAVQAYIAGKKEYWAIVDSFTLAADEEAQLALRRQLLSDRLIDLVEDHSATIAGLWLADVQRNRSTPTYHTFDPDMLFERVFLVIAHFGQWLAGSCRGQDLASYYQSLGRERRMEGFALSEVVSALTLLKKHIWEFALARGVWRKTVDIYTILELERRISLFFDRAVYHVARGYEGEGAAPQQREDPHG